MHLENILSKCQRQHEERYRKITVTKNKCLNNLTDLRSSLIVGSAKLKATESPPHYRLRIVPKNCREIRRNIYLPTQ